MVSSPDNAELVEAFAAVFPKVPREELPTLTMASCADWDSLASVTLIAVVEEQFGIAIEPDDMEQLVSFELVQSLIEDKQT